MERIYNSRYKQEVCVTKCKNLLGRTMHMKIRNKLIICFLIPAVFTLLLGVFAYRTTSKIVIENYETSMSQTVGATSNYFEKVLENVKFKANQLISDTSMQGYFGGSADDDEKEKIGKNVKALAKQDIYSITMLPRKEVTVLTAGKDPYATTEDKDSKKKESKKTDTKAKDGKEEEEEEKEAYNNELFQAFTESEEGSVYNDGEGFFFWLGNHSFLDEKLGIEPTKYGLCLLRRFTNASSYTSGYIFLDVRMSAITDVFSGIEMPEGGSLSFVSPDGRELCYHDKYNSMFDKKFSILDSTNAATMELAGVKNEDLISQQAFYQSAIAEESKNGYHYVSYQGQQQLFVWEKLEDGIVVCAMIPKAQIVAEANSIRNSCIVLLFIAIIVAVGIGLIVSSRLSKVIHSMIASMNKVATGDLSVVFTTKRRDEFRKLNDSANNMIRNTKSLIEKVASTTNQLNDSSTHMTENTGILLEATNNIAHAIDEIQQGILHQASEAEECRNISTTLESKINDVSNYVTSIQKVAEESNQNVGEGLQSIDSLTEIIHETAHVTQLTIDNMTELHQETSQIDQILTVINDIAEQTNLLSLNASIEAARAGESGRGFMVVAEEIRKLAEMSLQSASKIGEMIQHIQRKTNQTADNVKNTENLMSKEQTELENVVLRFNNINSSVNKMVQSLQMIHDEIRGMEESKEQTIQSIRGISEISEESAASSEEVNATASEQLVAVDSLNEAAQQLSLQAEELQKEINKFHL